MKYLSSSRQIAGGAGPSKLDIIVPTCWECFLALRFLAVALASLSALSFAQESPEAAQGPAVEKWTGTLNAGGTQLRLYIEWTPDDDAKRFQGHLVSLDQGEGKIPLERVTRNGTTLKIEVPKIGGSFEGEVLSDGSSVKGTWSQGGNSLPLTLTVATGIPRDKLLEAWTGTLKAGQQDLELQIRILESGGERIVKFDSLSQHTMGLSTVLQPDKERLKFEVPAVQGRFDGSLNPARDVAKGDWMQGGMKMPLTLRKILKPVEKLPAAARPQTPKEPFPYEQKSVSIDHSAANVVLAATLTIPEGDGPFPSVVLVSGSGPQDRDESLLGHKPFWILADHLSRNGIAVLRYDDRGVGESTGDFAVATSIDFAADTTAALRFLQEQSRIDKSRLGIVGHSEGGLVATMLSASDLPLAHVVLLAGPGVPGDEIIYSQTAAISEGEGLTAEAMASQLKGTLEITRLVAQGASEQVIRDKIAQIVQESKSTELESEEGRQQAQDAMRIGLSQMNSPWFRFFLKYDPRTDLRKARCPVLALIGEKDLQVLPKLNLPQIEAALKESAIQDFRCVELPGLNHLFQTATNGAPSEYQAIEETMSPNVLGMVTDWIREH